jgi:hypothetical protein
LPPGLGEAIYLGVRHGVAVLHAAVVTGCDYFPGANQNRANGQPAFRQALLGLLNGGQKEGFVMIG